MNFFSENKIRDASINEIINKDDEYYYYKVSLTTVPCIENVNWIVFMFFKQFNLKNGLKIVIKTIIEQVMEMQEVQKY